MTGHSFTRSGPEIDIEELQRLRSRLLPPYRVILFNDEYNEMNYVVFALLHAVSSLTQQEAERIMLTAHLKGTPSSLSVPKRQRNIIRSGCLAMVLPRLSNLIRNLCRRMIFPLCQSWSQYPCEPIFLEGILILAGIRT